MDTYMMHEKLVQKVKALEEEVSKFRQSEKVMRWKEERLRLLQDASFGGIILHEKGFIQDTNQSVSDMTGYKYEELIGMNGLQLISAKWRDKVMDKVLSGYENPFVVEGVRRDGSTYPLEIQAKVIPYHSRSVGVIELRDITVRKGREDELRRSERELDIIVKHSEDVIYRLDPDGKIAFISDAVKKYGCTPEELLGQDILNFVHPEDREDARHRITERRTGDRSTKRLEIRLFSKDQNTFRFETIEKGVSDEGLFSVDAEGMYETERPRTSTFIGTLGIARNITKSKQADTEKARLESQLQHAQKMEAVGTLAGGISHDFNNLLQGILGYTQMLLLDKGKENPEFGKLKEIEKAAERASELTRQLLTFSRKVESKLLPVDINHEVKQIHNLLKRTIPKMIAIELHLADDLKTVKADPAQIEQVLMNLALNARDAMSETGRIVIETENITLDEEYCKTHLGAKPGDYVLFTVSDTGHGMDKETLAHIFEPFYTTKEIGKGTGLGLAMVYGIIKSHRGNIICYSEPGEGTSFKVYLPVIEPIDNFSEVEQEQDLPVGGNETVLLVDDEDLVLELGEQILTRFGYRVFTATEGEGALELYRQKSKEISIVILDLIMPGMGGRKCLEELIKIDPKAKVIVSSGYTDKLLAEDAIKASACGFISKPYRLMPMLKVLREVLNAAT